MGGRLAFERAKKTAMVKRQGKSKVEFFLNPESFTVDAIMAFFIYSFQSINSAVECSVIVASLFINTQKL